MSIDITSGVYQSIDVRFLSCWFFLAIKFQHCHNYGFSYCLLCTRAANAKQLTSFQISWAFKYALLHSHWKNWFAHCAYDISARSRLLGSILDRHPATWDLQNENVWEPASKNIILILTKFSAPNFLHEHDDRTKK